jgi:ubiquinone/menaquinone biosynthesis C-methylase UbiE
MNLRGLVRRLRGRASADARRGTSSPRDYWTHYTVAQEPHASREASLAFLSWRNHQYLGYKELMPTSGAQGLVVLDYGCGPGNDLVGFWEQSRPKRLIGMEVSPTALELSRKRLALHHANVELMEVAEGDVPIPLEDACVDLVHCSGVLHHTPNPDYILREFHRVLRPGGRAQVMVYNYDSLWLHLYADYLFRAAHNLDASVSALDAFRASTDGLGVPISVCYKPAQFARLAETAGFRVHHRGNSISCEEMIWLNQRYEALRDRRLPEESRQFLYELRFNEAGLPTYRGQVAGINSTFDLAFH